MTVHIPLSQGFVAAYDAAALSAHGEYASLNYPKEMYA